MGYFHTDERPPERPSKLGRIVPGWVKNRWEAVAETLMLIRVVFGIMLPVVGVMMGFVLVFGLLIGLASVCSGSA